MVTKWCPDKRTRVRLRQALQLAILTEESHLDAITDPHSKTKRVMEGWEDQGKILRSNLRVFNRLLKKLTEIEEAER